MVHQMLGAVAESALEEAVLRIKDQHPQLNDKEVFRRVVKKLAPPSIVGTPGYYRQNLHELLVYANKNGMPHLFVTLTADEVSELRWDSINDLERFLDTKVLPGMTWQDAPIECARLFHDRLMHLMHEHILKSDGSGIFGRVQGYMIRYESQTRASLHCHMLLWLHPDDVERVCDEVTASLPCCYEKMVMADGKEVFEPKLPEDINDGSIVSNLIKIVERKQMHRCDDSEYGCIQDNGLCAEGYPYAANRQGTVYDQQRGVYKYLRMGPRDSRIVPYHPLLLLLWNAGCNVQRVTNSAWSKYVLKYATKAEPSGQLEIDSGTAAQLGIYGVSEQRIKFASAAVLSKAVSPSETACITAGIPIINTSYDVLYVDASPPAKRRAFLSKGCKISASHVTLYMSRPDGHCRTLLFEEYFAQYMVVKHASKVQQPNKATAEPPSLDMMGNRVYKCKEPRLIRTTDFHPIHQSEGFWYKRLLFTKAWNSEEEMKSCDGSWFNECVRQGVVTSMADIEKAIEEYGAFHMHDTVLIDQLRDMFVQQQDLSYLWGSARQPHEAERDTQHQQDVDAFYTLQEIMGWQGHPEERDCDKDGSGDASLDEATQEATMTTMNDTPAGCVPGVPTIALADLNHKQKCFVDEVLRMVQTPQLAAFDYQMPRVVFLRGGPGTGKTATLQVLLTLLDCCPVLIGATTAAAAQRLNRPGEADTIDSLLGLWVGREFGLLPIDSPVRAKIEACGVCVCDEFSMLTFDKLMYIKHRLRSATKAGQPVKVLILSGDEQQLPPVCKHKVNDNVGFCRKCHVCSTPDWADAQHHELTEVYRSAKDPPLMHFLNSCRQSNPSWDNIKYILGDCCEAEADLDSLLCEGVTVLCTHLDLVRDSNAKALQWHHDRGLLDSDVYPVLPDTNAWMDADLSSWVAKHHMLTAVAVGAPVVFNFNAAKSVGCVNSARGRITAVHTDKGGQYVEALTVELEGTGRSVVVKRSIVKRKWHNGVSYYLTTFPLQLAWAVTAHKCQGLTLHGKVVLRIKDCFAAGMMYVMLSRVTERQDLAIMGELQPALFKRLVFADG